MPTPQEYLYPWSEPSGCHNLESTYLFIFIRSTLSTQTSFDNCMAIRYRRLFRILRSQFWINFIGALLLYHTALSMERTDKRMQTHAHAHSHTHARVDIT